MSPFVREELLSHALGPHFDRLRAIRTRRALERSDLWRHVGDEARRVLGAVERADHPLATGPRDPTRLRACAWNVQRGARLPQLRGLLANDPNVARQLALSLGASYAFGVSYLALEDDLHENPDHVPSTLALAGCAILSRVPLGRVENVDLPELRDKFSSSQKRLGKKRALMAELLLPGGPVAILAAHLDSNASPAGRARQLDFLLARSRDFPRALLGGDLNTTTYDTSSLLALARDLLHKLFVTGFNRTVENYLTPERRYETPVFATLAAHGFTACGFNDRARGSMRYDLASPVQVDKVRAKVGGALTRLLQWRLRPWGGVVPARLDWFAGRGLLPLAASVVDPGWPDGASDHAAITVDVAL
jgi:hypothetical protein